MSEQTTDALVEVMSSAARAVTAAFQLGKEAGRIEGYDEQASDHHNSLITYDERMAEVAWTAERNGLLAAAEAWENEETPELFRIAEEHYRAGGPSMPTIWLRLRARALPFPGDADVTEGAGADE